MINLRFNVSLYIIQKKKLFHVILPTPPSPLPNPPLKTFLCMLYDLLNPSFNMDHINSNYDFVVYAFLLPSMINPPNRAKSPEISSVTVQNPFKILWKWQHQMDFLDNFI